MTLDPDFAPESRPCSPVPQCLESAQAVLVQSVFRVGRVQHPCGQKIYRGG